MEEKILVYINLARIQFTETCSVLKKVIGTTDRPGEIVLELTEKASQA
jgi:hypothetical protein